MSRAERLLELMQALRRRRQAVAGNELAVELGVSLRTLYRDVASLRAQGAGIDGDPGVGYVLRPGFLLPPLMFSPEEIEALVLGSRWVAMRADASLGRAADNALAKISSVLPAEARLELESNALMVGPGDRLQIDDAVVAGLRQAIREERKLHIDYEDLKGRISARVIWPFGLGFFDRVRVVLAWCELRQDLRHFRTDRIRTMSQDTLRYPRRRQSLLREWKKRESAGKD